MVTNVPLNRKRRQKAFDVGTDNIDKVFDPMPKKRKGGSAVGF